MTTSDIDKLINYHNYKMCWQREEYLKLYKGRRIGRKNDRELFNLMRWKNLKEYHKHKEFLILLEGIRNELYRGVTN